MNKKILTIVGAAFCAVLLVAGSIMGTLAYLTSTASVTNTFTVGNVSITLTESKSDGSNERVTEENNYHLVPGTTYDKDPLITVAANSEASYIFVKVENGLSALEAAGESSIATQLKKGGWKLLTEYVEDYNEGKEPENQISTPITNAANVYVYNGNSATDYVVAKSNTNVDIQVFKTFSLKGDADLSTLDDTDDDGTIDATIEVTAYAVQATGLANPYLAWTTAFGNVN
ncbi:MAG: SipW-dependent-type signal peptide-containing protein [Clostridia bacterium]|nr:SipW-dependent-type signal peptide-containing protein [Clostridia bacterium]